MAATEDSDWIRGLVKWGLILRWLPIGSCCSLAASFLPCADLIPSSCIGADPRARAKRTTPHLDYARWG